MVCKVNIRNWYSYCNEYLFGFIITVCCSVLQEENNIAFIGPNAAAITGMGDKIQSKKLAIDAGVNTIPGESDIVDCLWTIENADVDHCVSVYDRVICAGFEGEIADVDHCMTV